MDIEQTVLAGRGQSRGGFRRVQSRGSFRREQLYSVIIRIAVLLLVINKVLIRSFIGRFVIYRPTTPVAER